MDVVELRWATATLRHECGRSVTDHVPTCGSVRGTEDHILTSGNGRGVADYVPMQSAVGPCHHAVNNMVEGWWATAHPGTLDR